MKEALTYTIIAGSIACPNNCRVCISKMTPDYGIDYKKPEVEWNTFEKATTIALNHKAKNVLITGKGEPTLYPGQITQYLLRLKDKPFDRRELQTDGSLLAKGGLYDDFLDVWKDLELDVIAISMYHYKPEENKDIFRPKSGKLYDLPKLIEKIHSKGLKVRLSCVMMDGYIDSIDEIKNLVDYTKENEVFQLTLRRIGKPQVKDAKNKKVLEFVEKHELSDKQMEEIYEFFKKEAIFCDKLAHNALVYEYKEQNVCLTDCLSYDPGKEEIRNLIFFPRGWLTTSWENVQGGRIL